MHLASSNFPIATQFRLHPRAISIAAFDVSDDKKWLKQYTFHASGGTRYRRLFQAPRLLICMPGASATAHQRKWALPAVNGEGIFSESSCEMHLLTHSYFMGRVRPCLLREYPSLLTDIIRSSPTRNERSRQESGRRSQECFRRPKRHTNDFRDVLYTWGNATETVAMFEIAHRVLIILGESKTEKLISI